jgi:hypothetical protein
MTIVAFTSITPNYLAKARVLATSLKRFHPEIRFHLVLAETCSGIGTTGEPFDVVVGLDDLGLSTRRGWIFEHTVVEFCTAIKGLYSERLLADPDVEAMLYFDPDIAVLGSLEPVLEGLREGSVLLTPHQIEPETQADAVIDNEICCLRHGVFNLGFLALKNSAEGRSFAAWWNRRLTSFCQVELESGIFTDQRWVDLAPALFDEVVVLRHPGLNVATWNFTHRVLAGEAPYGVLVNGKPLSFFHFSGFDGGAQLWMSIKYAGEMPVVFDLRNWYIRACAEMGQQEVAGIPWSYGAYDNGASILTEHRKLYRKTAGLRRRFPDPFSATDPARSYHHWLASGAGT